MKSYTDLEQSKKLAEFLPIESADMYYFSNKNCDSIECGFDYTKRLLYVDYGDGLPCWSLAALLRIIPKRIKAFNVLRIDISENDFALWYDEIGYGVNDELPDIWMKEPVDACVKMILKLHEQKLL